MAARFKGQFDQALATGWQAERFARDKSMKPLGEYLKEERKPDPDEGARALRAMLARRRAMKEKRDGGE